VTHLLALRRKSGVKPPTCRVEHSEFLHAVYRACLHREPDPGGLRRYLEQLESNTLDWEGVLRACSARRSSFPSRKHDLPRTAPCTASTARA